MLRRLSLANTIEDWLKIYQHDFQWKSLQIDRETLLHKGHISSGGSVVIWKTALTKEEIDMITQRYKSWLIDAGYSV